jgi:methionyl aminopeptidase
MRISSQGAFASDSFVTLKDLDWLEKQRVAGRVVAGALLLLQGFVESKSDLSLIKMNELAEEFILDQDCELTFKGYKGFPAGVCISVNKQLVHGIPIDYHLQEGDVISFDLGATYKGAIADSAITCIFGEPKSSVHTSLLQATEEALMAGINAIQVGKKLGCIGNAIHKTNKKYGFGLITKYGGHGLDWNHPHAAPFVENKADPGDGIRIQPGLAIAIEPMLVIGDTYTYVDKDGWTVWGQNISAHFEHSVFVHEDKVEIITRRDNVGKI